MARLKRDFNDLISDKWTRKGAGDPSVEHDLGHKIYAWGNYADAGRMGGETMSERLWRTHSRPMVDPTPLPKLYVYHRSTWMPYQQH